MTRWQEWAQARALPSLFDELMHLHYDPLYERSQSKHFVQWDQRSSWEVDDLSDAAIERLAQSIASA